VGERDEKFAVLYEVGRYINSSLDLAELLELVVDSLIRVTGAERGFIMLADPDSGELRVEVARNFDRSTMETPSFAVSQNVVRTVVEQGTPLLASDALSDPGLERFQSVAIHRLRSIMCAPLQVKGSIIGAMYVDNRLRSGLFEEAELDLLVAFADQAAMAIENARLYRGLQERLREIAALQAYQENIFRSVASGVVVLDHAGRITSLNPAAEAIFGTPAGAVRGASYQAALGPDIAQFIRAHLAGVHLPQQQTRLGQDLVCDVPGRGLVYLSVRATSLLTADEQVSGLVLAIEDRTEKRLLEKAHQAEEDKRRLLSRFFSPAVLEEILRNPEAAAKLAGVRKELTVLFADIRGYTSLSESAPPEQVVTLLNHYLELATRAIRACDGTVDKYIGDAVLALFNAPTDQASHAQSAVWAALALQGTSVRLREVVEREVQFGIGVNTGEAVAGYVGTSEQLSYTAIGDAVNIAARLQVSAAPGEVLISEATYVLVREDFEAHCLGPLEVKGRSEPVIAYRVLGPRIAPVSIGADRQSGGAGACPACGGVLLERQTLCPSCQAGWELAGAGYLELTEGRRVPLAGDAVTLGRGLENSVVLADTEISRRHARLQRLPQGWLLIDLNSSNGTRLNGIELEGPCLLENGDVIALGDQRLEYHAARVLEHETLTPQRTAPETLLGRLAFQVPSGATFPDAQGE
jgi:adenylate cyclase